MSILGGKPQNLNFCTQRTKEKISRYQNERISSVTIEQSDLSEGFPELSDDQKTEDLYQRMKDQKRVHSKV